MYGPLLVQDKNILINCCRFCAFKNIGSIFMIVRGCQLQRKDNAEPAV